METPSARKPYPSDVTDEERAFVAPYLTLMDPAAPQRRHDLREVLNAQRWIANGCFEAMVHDLRALLRTAEGREPDPSAVVLDARTLRSTPESGHRAGYDGHERTKGPKVHAAVDTLGYLLAVRATSADEQERAQVAALAEAVQAATGEAVELAYVDQGYAGADPALDAADHSIRLEVMRLADAKRGFVLLPRRWIVERRLAWASRFRRLARDHERLPATVAGLHFVAFAYLMLHGVALLPSISP